MKTKKSSKKVKLLTNNWVVTLTATLIGVFLALYLNENVSSNKVKVQKEIATENIRLEIQQNQERLEKNIKKHKAMLSVFQFIKEHLDEEGRVVTSVDSMQVFRAKFPKVFIVQDSSLLNNGKYHYQGEMDLNLDLSYINLTNLAWETFKNSGLTTSYDFNCLMFLEKLDRITEETLNQEKKVFEMLKNSGLHEKDDYEDKLRSELKFLIDYENGLLESYRHSKEELKNCG